MCAIGVLFTVKMNDCFQSAMKNEQMFTNWPRCYAHDLKIRGFPSNSTKRHKIHSRNCLRAAVKSREDHSAEHNGATL